MKLSIYIMVFVLLVILFQSDSAKQPESNKVILTAREVDGAEDIEAAILCATEKRFAFGHIYP